MRKKILAGILAVAMSVTMIPGNLMEKAGVKENAEAAVTLQNPRIEADSSMEAGQKVTYDCIWFGSYPQTEIVDQPSTCGVYNKSFAQSSDYEENSSLYASLKNASGWDSKGDVIISGTKYRRIKSSDAVSAMSSPYYYSWDSSDTYHYFRYEPIKWRVLQASGNNALLLADIVLDVQSYNTTLTEVTWETSTIRSWLNGYGPSDNIDGTDYTEKNFINNAFSMSEQNIILSSSLDNQTTGTYAQQFGGENTTDKVFLLSAYDLYKSEASASYGFYKASYSNFDNARKRKSSTYAKAMGTYSSTTPDYYGCCWWWLRSPGYTAKNAVCVDERGYINDTGRLVDKNSYVVCPAINLDLSSSNLYSYAGTVCTDGTVNEQYGDSETPTTYTIRYLANGGYGNPASQTKTKNVSLTLSNTVPKKDGYTFLGWGKNSSSTGAIYQPGDTYSIDSSITLYAIWVKTITLTYNANGGSEVPASQSKAIYNSETSYTFTITSSIPKKEGYSFVGWGIGPSETATYGSGEQLTLSEDTTIFAIWTQGDIVDEKATLTYSNANGGDNIPNSRTVDINTSVIISDQIPVKDSYTFLGWSPNKNATGASIAPGDTINISGDLTLYAIWQKDIMLTYDTNGGGTAPASQYKTIYNTTTSCSMTISGIVPTKRGYKFLGWGLTSTDTSASYAPRDEIDLTSSLTLYAVWKKDEESADDPVEPDPAPIVKKNQTILASGKTVAINNAAFNLNAKTSGNGTMTYKSSNTKVAAISSIGTITVKGYGTTTITIIAPETSAYYKAAKNVTITVVPKKMKLKSVKSPKKGQLQIIWKKDKAADGYQIQFSRDMNFKKGVYQKAVSKKLVKLKKPVTGLISKKRYYVRIRSYKKISGKKLYGIWSYGKVVKIK